MNKQIVNRGGQNLNKLGFTLVELLGVLIILGAIVLIVFPSILNQVKKSQGKINETTKELFFTATDLYLGEHQNTYGYIEGDTYCITLDALVKDGKLRKPLKDSRGKELDLEMFVQVKVKQNKEIEYEFVNSCTESNTTPGIPEDPNLIPGEPVKEYVDSSGANSPDLLSNMIPVKYDGVNWFYADTNEEWYNYDNQKWANAVVLNSEVTKKKGDIIKELDVALWYVWIPRYKYQLFNVNNGSITEQLIEVEFESGTETTGTVSCTTASNGVETCTNASSGNWYTHPAFTLGTKQLTGIWVGKFEISTTDSTCNNSASTANCNKELPVTIKPNVSSWRNANVSNFYTSIQNMASAYSVSNGDSHMMKNIEWGAVAYLKQSMYGLGTTDIAINSNTSYLTGGGSSNAYKTNTAQSTTGNIYGIYDMSGGAHENVMGNMVNSSGSFYSSSAGFTTVPTAKYYDSYSYDSSNTTHARGHLGDGTKETLKTFGSTTGGWYSDLAIFPRSNSNYSWFLRGGYYNDGGNAGVFQFNYGTGESYIYHSARAALSHK